MAVRQIGTDVYQISLGYVNAFLIDGGQLTLIDTGVPSSGEKIVKAIQDIGRQPKDLGHILLTHCHFDHTGSLAMLKEATGAQTYMHQADAALLAAGKMMRPVGPAPVWWSKLMFSLLPVGRLNSDCEPIVIDHEIGDGDTLDIGGELQVIHVPGHCAGQLAFLSPRDGGILFAADACMNMAGMGYAPIYEDVEAGERSLEKLAELAFETVGFGHGRSIVGGASDRFRQRWLPA